MKFDATIKMILEASGLSKTMYIGCNFYDDENSYDQLYYAHSEELFQREDLQHVIKTNSPVFVVACYNDDNEISIKWRGGTIQDILNQVNKDATQWGLGYLTTGQYDPDTFMGTFTLETFKEFIKNGNIENNSDWYLFDHGKVIAQPEGRTSIDLDKRDLDLHMSSSAKEAWGTDVFADL